MATFDRNWPVPIIDTNLCDGCGKCVQACPAGALELKEGKAVVSAGKDCSYYGICEIICPTGAISRPFLVVSL